MTTQPDATPDEGRSAGSITNPLRELIAFVLLGANALLLLVALINLLVPYGPGSAFTDRAGGSFFDFVSVLPIALPLLAVLLATHISPVVARAKLITQVALVEYAVSAVFGAIAALAWLVGTLADGELRSAFTGLLLRIAYAGVFLCAAFVVYKIWRTLYYVPRPKAPAPQPGVYGQQGQPPQAYNQAPQAYGPPGAGYPAGYPQPPGYPSYPPNAPTGPPAYGQPAPYPGYQPQPEQPGQPGYPPAGGYEQPGQPGYPPAGGYDQPGQPGYPPAEPPVAGPYTMPSAQAPASGPPAPSSAPPASQPPATDGDRTQIINPASQQPSAGAAPPPSHRDDDEPTQPGR